MLQFKGVYSGLTLPEQLGGNSWLTRSFVVTAKFKCKRESRPPFLPGVGPTASVNISCVCTCAYGGY